LIPNTIEIRICNIGGYADFTEKIRGSDTTQTRQDDVKIHEGRQVLSADSQYLAGIRRIKEQGVLAVPQCRTLTPRICPAAAPVIPPSLR
jgi:hypothetical protein